MYIKGPEFIGHLLTYANNMMVQQQVVLVYSYTHSSKQVKRYEKVALSDDQSI